MNNGTLKQPLGAAVYAVIALISLLIAIGFTVFYIRTVPQLVREGVSEQVFYLLLIPWALSSAAFLFGAMRSYARFRGKKDGSMLELGGPVVLFCLVIIGGFWIIPRKETNLAVRVQTSDGLLLKSGDVTLDLPGLPKRSIGGDGEANFKGLSAKSPDELSKIKVLTEADGYEQTWLTPTVNGDILTVTVNKTQPTFDQRFEFVPPPTKSRHIKISVNGRTVEPVFDDVGEFVFKADANDGDRVLIEVFVNGNKVVSEYSVLSRDPITIHWATKPR